MQFEGLLSSAWSTLDIEVVIKPQTKNGLVLFNGDRRDGHGDFVLLALRNGSAELRYDCGTGEAIIKYVVWLRSRRLGREALGKASRESNHLLYFGELRL